MMKQHMYKVVLKSRTDIVVTVTLDDIALDHYDMYTAKQAALLFMGAPDMWLVHSAEYKGCW